MKMLSDKLNAPAPLDRDWLARCAGKIGYPSQGAALRVCQHVNKARIHPYHCPHCDSWHVGRGR